MMDKKEVYRKYIEGFKEVAYTNKGWDGFAPCMDWVIEFCEKNDCTEEFVDCDFSPVRLYALCKIRLKAT